MSIPYVQDVQTVGYFVTTSILILSFWKLGGNTASNQVIATYKEQVGQLRDQVSELTNKVGVLTGQLREKDDRIKTLESIATNRNPELETFMKYVTETMKQSSGINTEVQAYMKNSTDYLRSIEEKLEDIEVGRSGKKNKVRKI